MKLLKNSIWNIGGYAIPTLISIPLLAIISREIGIEKFSILLMFFSIVGYASIFDAGLSRSIVWFVAKNKNNIVSIGNAIYSSSLIVIAIGLIISLLIFFLSFNVTNLLNVSHENFDDISKSIKLLSFAIVPFLFTKILMGYFEGIQEFNVLNVHKSISGILLMVLPTVSTSIDSNLTTITYALVLARVISMIYALFLISRVIKIKNMSFDWDMIKSLLKFGGWVTASNIISPIMVYFDRFILSNMLGAKVASIYIIPSEIVSKLSIFPAAIAKAIFPLLSSNLSSIDNVKKYSEQSFWMLLISSLVIAAPIFTFSNELLYLWIGPETPKESGLILKVLIVGFVCNALAQLPFSKIQAEGGSHVTAYVHIVEMPVYLLFLYIMVKSYGVFGAAVIWSIRNVVDLVILQFLSCKKGRVWAITTLH
ncbi:TPA: flippase [Vibrio cholerae]|nr:flippase [Vibrio cholerae]